MQVRIPAIEDHTDELLHHRKVLTSDRLRHSRPHLAILPAVPFELPQLYHVASGTAMGRSQRERIFFLTRLAIIVTKDVASALDIQNNVTVLVDHASAHLIK